MSVIPLPYHCLWEAHQQFGFTDSVKEQFGLWIVYFETLTDGGGI